MNRLENGNLKFNEEEISNIKYEEGVYDNITENQLFEVISEKIVDTDLEKSSSDVKFVIRELLTDKFYTATILDSMWNGEAEYNSKIEWIEVKPKTKTIVTYE